MGIGRRLQRLVGDDRNDLVSDDRNDFSGDDIVGDDRNDLLGDDKTGDDLNDEDLLGGDRGDDRTLSLGGGGDANEVDRILFSGEGLLVVVGDD